MKTCYLKTTHPFIQFKTEYQAFDIKKGVEHEKRSKEWVQRVAFYWKKFQAFFSLT